MLEWLFAASVALSCNDTSHAAIVAHRGGMDSAYPENTVPAFLHAAAAGAHAIELDLRATRDGEIVVLHDSRVDRTTNGHGRIRHLTSRQVRRLETGDGIGIPTLREVLSKTKGLGVDLVLDLKAAPGLELDEVVAEAGTHGRLEQIIFGIRSVDDLTRLAGVRSDLRVVGFVPGLRQVDEFLEGGAEIIRLWPHWLHRHPDLPERIHAAGARVWVTAGTASVEELVRMAALGVDGLLTDHPVAAAAGLACR